MVDGVIIESIPRWVEYAIAGPLLVYFIATAGITLTKAGRHPAWALLLLIPYVQLVAVWVFAFTKWPRLEYENIETKNGKTAQNERLDQSNKS